MQNTFDQKTERKKKKKTEHSNNSNTNYRTEMNLLPTNMEHCLLQIDSLNSTQFMR